MADDESKLTTRDLVTAAVRSGAEAVSVAKGVWRSDGAKKIRGGVKNAVAGLAGVSRFVRSNTIRGLLTGEITLSEGQLNRWFSTVEPPESVLAMSLKCRPSRIVLVMEFERRLLGLRVGRDRVSLPFEIMDVEIDSNGGHIELVLDKDATSQVRGFLKPIIMRLLSRAASDLLDGDPLDDLDEYADVVRRDGDRFFVDIGNFPPYLELMGRELRLPGGRSLFPFRALVIERAIVAEGKMIIKTHYDRGRITGVRELPGDDEPHLLDEDELHLLDEDELENELDDESVEVTII